MLKGKTALGDGFENAGSDSHRAGTCCAGREHRAQRLRRPRGSKGQVEALGVKVGYHGADMSKPAEIEAMMAYIDQEFGGVRHPGRTTPASSTWPTIDEFPPEKWDAIIAINLVRRLPRDRAWRCPA